MWLILLFLCLLTAQLVPAQLGPQMQTSRSEQERIRGFLQPPLFPSENLAPHNVRLSTNTRYECKHESRNQKFESIPHMRGTSLGGWLVLEPWITPSLFYQFLGVSEKFHSMNRSRSIIDHVAIDSLTFCKALGAKEANRQLRIHWNSWVTEDRIRSLAEKNTTHIRIPIPDWIYIPYGPFKECFEGALEMLDKALHWADKYDLKVLLDLHAVRGSQNGLDNSGDTSHYEWIFPESSSATTSSSDTIRGDEEEGLRYRHWDIRGGDWAGRFDTSSGQYQSLNESNIFHTLQVINAIVQKYKDRPIVVGIQPLNEPWDKIPLAVIKEFYWRSYNIIRLAAPHWLVVFHDSFRLTDEVWAGKENGIQRSDTRRAKGGFLFNCDHYVVDTHLYLAWAVDSHDNITAHIQTACGNTERLRHMENIGVPVIVGEWSLATDNCAMWLNGLNDNVPGYPKVQCNRIKCPDPYFEKGLIPNAPPDPTQYRQDPFGTGGESYVEYGTCPVDRIWPNEKADIKRFAFAQLHAYDLYTHGFFFWNFRTELESRWDFEKAVSNGWMPTRWGDKATMDAIVHACPIHEDPDMSHINSSRLSSVSYVLVGLALLSISMLVWFCGSGGRTVHKMFTGDWFRRRRGYEPIPEEESTLAHI